MSKKSSSVEVTAENKNNNNDNNQTDEQLKKDEDPRVFTNLYLIFVVLSLFAICLLLFVFNIAYGFVREPSRRENPYSAPLIYLGLNYICRSVRYDVGPHVVVTDTPTSCSKLGSRRAELWDAAFGYKFGTYMNWISSYFYVVLLINFVVFIESFIRNVTYHNYNKNYFCVQFDMVKAIVFLILGIICLAHCISLPQLFMFQRSFSPDSYVIFVEFTAGYYILFLLVILLFILFALHLTHWLIDGKTELMSGVSCITKMKRRRSIRIKEDEPLILIHRNSFDGRNK